MTSSKFYTTQCQICGKENERTGIQLLRWPYQNGRIRQDKDCKPRNINPTKYSLENKKASKKRKATTFTNLEDKDLDQGQKGKKFCQYHGTC